MGHEEAAREVFEVEALHFVEVPDPAVGDDPDATEGPVDGDLHFPPERPRRFGIHILEHRHGRFGGGLDPGVVGLRQGLLLLRRGRRGRDLSGDGIPHDPPAVVEHLPDRRLHAPFGPWPDPEELDGVRYSGGVELLQFLDLWCGQHRVPPASS